MSAGGQQNRAALAGSPKVSHNDLFDFYQCHFSPSAVVSFGTDFVCLPERQESSEYHVIQEGEDDDDDGLGYYEDGVKRTLTDEQIEIFRHSELRELRRQLERARSSKSAGNHDGVMEENKVSATPGRSTTPPGTRNSKKKKKKGKGARQEPKPDLRKRTWDVVDAGLDSLDYD